MLVPSYFQPPTSVQVSVQSPSTWFRRQVTRRVVALTGFASLTLSLWAAPASAGDPFRTNNPRPISAATEAAFTEVFRNGNYPLAEEYLRRADENDPMTHALRASLAYIGAAYKPQESLDAFRRHSTRTREVAEQLLRTDALRGNLYLAVGHFLEGAYILLSQGTVRGTPQALNKLQEVFKYIKEAEKVDSADPELNMVKGFMDLMLAVNLPFSNANQAIERLEKFAGPRYLASRGIALGYRDLGQYDRALEYINRALQENPTQPEDNYIKAQILVLKSQKENNPAFNAEASKHFKASLAKPNQLPRALVWQIFFEYCNNQVLVDRQARQCAPLRDQINLNAGLWGPKPNEMPQL